MGSESNKVEKEKIFKVKDYMYMAYIAVFLMFVILLVVLSLLSSAALMLTADTMTTPGTGILGISILVMVYVAPMFVLVRWYHQFIKGRAKTPFSRQFGWMLAGVVIYTVSTLAIGYFVYAGEGPDIISIPEGRSMFFIPVYIIGMVILLPMFEEYLMRGVLIERFFTYPSELTNYYQSVLYRFGIQEHHIRITILYVIQIVAFTLLHADGSNASVLLNAILGVLLTTVYLKTRAIWVPIMIHASVNIIGLMMIIGN